MLTTDGSPSTFKIRPLSDVHSMTFNSYMNKVERTVVFIHWKKKAGSDLEDPAAVKWNV